MKIDVRPLKIGKKWVDVIGTWGQQDMADEIMIASLQPQTHKKILDSVKAEHEFRKKAMGFLKSILQLSDKQVAQIKNNVPGEKLNLYLSYACGIVKGTDETSFEDFEKEVVKSKGPKEQSVKSGKPLTTTNKK